MDKAKALNGAGSIPAAGGLKAAAALALSAMVCAGAGAADPEATQADLDKVRRQIMEVQKTLRSRTTQRDSVAAKLRDAELTVARARAAVEEVRRRQASGEAERSRLQARRREAEQALHAQRTALAHQLRAAHRAGAAGRLEPLRLIFNQRDPAQLGRMWMYYGYFARSRAQRVAAVNSELEQLKRLEAQIEATNAALRRLERQASEELRALQQARAQRATAVSTLERQIKNRQNELARLKKEEDTLEKLLATLRRVTADFPITSEEPFERAKGRLSWPVDGRIVADFGQRRAAGLTWNGVLLATERGAPVRAVYFGRVIYSDWLPGMGLLAILEHRGGYLSLYGHNDQLFKSVGDWVEAGEVIAGVGDTGGRGQPELYFEIRKGARPLNPRQWIRK